jgi:hypothetical protein
MSNVLAPKRQIRIHQSGKFVFAVSADSDTTDAQVAARAKAAMKLGDNYVARHHLGMINFVVPG